MSKKNKGPAKRHVSVKPDAPKPADVPIAAGRQGKPALPNAKGRFSPLVRHLIQGLVVASLLTFIKASWLEQTPFGEEMEHTSISLLQRELADSSSSRSNQMKIAVVDISSLQLAPQESSASKVSVTNRAELQQVVDNVARANPAAIGIDVYFEPDAYGQLTPEDEEFLDHCLALVGPDKKPIPVYVGIYESIARGQSRWLGYDKFGKLGTAILVPSLEGSLAPTGRMGEQLQVDTGGNEVSVDSMSYRLSKVANADGGSHRWLGSILHRAFPGIVQDRAPRSMQGIKDNEFQIDFGPVSTLMDARIAEDVVTQHMSDLQGKIVILGRATPGQTTDVFNIAGFSEPVPGVYIHAAAVETLLQSPLYFLSAWGRVLADLLTATLAFGLVWVAKQRVSEAAAESFEWYIPAAIAVAVSFAGCAWVDWTGIYWTDFLLVSLVLLVHSPVEHALKTVFGESAIAHR